MSVSNQHFPNTNSGLKQPMNQNQKLWMVFSEQGNSTSMISFPHGIQSAQLSLCTLKSSGYQKSVQPSGENSYSDQTPEQTEQNTPQNKPVKNKHQFISYISLTSDFEQMKLEEKNVEQSIFYPSKVSQLSINQPGMAYEQRAVGRRKAQLKKQQKNQDRSKKCECLMM